jgi:hypothetical protein
MSVEDHEIYVRSRIEKIKRLHWLELSSVPVFFCVFSWCYANPLSTSPLNASVIAAESSRTKSYKFSATSISISTRLRRGERANINSVSV